MRLLPGISGPGYPATSAPPPSMIAEAGMGPMDKNTASALPEGSHNVSSGHLDLTSSSGNIPALPVTVSSDLESGRAAGGKARRHRRNNLTMDGDHPRLQRSRDQTTDGQGHHRGHHPHYRLRGDAARSGLGGNNSLQLDSMAVSGEALPDTHGRNDQTGGDKAAGGEISSGHGPSGDRTSISSNEDVVPSAIVVSTLVLVIVYGVWHGGRMVEGFWYMISRLSFTSKT